MCMQYILLVWLIINNQWRINGRQHGVIKHDNMLCVKLAVACGGNVSMANGGNGIKLTTAAAKALA